MESSLAKGPRSKGKSRRSGAASEPTAPIAESLSPAPSFPIVGIGGSAGSLAAFREILHHLPADSGLALVIVSHQDPSVPSLLAEILAKATAMPVSQASDGTALEAGSVYVAPPGQYLGVHDGVLRHEGRIERLHTPLPIDAFFRSLAQDQKHRAIGVVVSGSGADGTLGLAAIREGTGLTLAQDPRSAEFPGMPASAVAARAVDLVLPAAEIAERLLVHAHQVATPRTSPAAALRATDSLEQIISLVAEHTRQDFSEYKRGTIQRRIERRLQLHQLGDLATYARFLHENPEELAALARDWLIGVSGFFRDAEAFAALARALPELLASRSNGGLLRAWVPGCATGQEAYSIAILLLEEIERARARVQLQIFATDLDPHAIETARAARYPEGIAAEVGPKRLTRFFTADDRSFVVNREVREPIVFAVQNLLHDPPFTKLDLLSCRNALIYFTTDAQKRIVPLFHYSLNPGGLLLLGSSESVTGFDELFTSLDRHWKLFRRVESGVTRHIPVDWASRTTFPSSALPKPAPGAGPPGGLTPADLLRRHLADHYGPPAVLADQRGQVSQIHGRTGAFLEPAPGQANLNVLDMARNGLRGPLSAAMRAVSDGQQSVAERTARVRSNGGFVPVRVRVARLAGALLPNPALLITFERLDERSREAAEPPPEPARPSSDRIGELEDELRSTRDDLQSTIEALQAANEELASSNEEVQSTNEELRTSKEETQSLNEELQTTNADLHAKVESLEQSNDDLTNLLASTGIAIVFLDEQLRVRRFTPAAQRLIPLVDSDVGRPLANLATPFGYPDLLAAAQRVLETLAPSEKEVRAESGAWYLARISPYRTARNAIEGLAIVFVDTTRAKRAELGEAVLELEKDLLEAVRDPFLVLDPALRVVRANRAFHRSFQMQPEDVEGHSVLELDDGAWDIPALRQLLEQILPQNQSFEDFELEHEFPRIGRRRLLLNARRVDRTEVGASELILLAIEDATEASGKGVERHD